MNQMIANQDKFKAIVLKRLNVDEALNVKVDLLGVAIDSNLTFDSYIRSICKKCHASLPLCLD